MFIFYRTADALCIDCRVILIMADATEDKSNAQLECANAVKLYIIHAFIICWKDWKHSNGSVLFDMLKRYLFFSRLHEQISERKQNAKQSRCTHSKHDEQGTVAFIHESCVPLHIQHKRLNSTLPAMHCLLEVSVNTNIDSES